MEKNPGWPFLENVTIFKCDFKQLSQVILMITMDTADKDTLCLHFVKYFGVSHMLK